MTVGLELIPYKEAWLPETTYEIRITNLNNLHSTAVKTYSHELEEVITSIDKPKDCMTCIVPNRYLSFIPYRECCPNETYSNLEKQLSEMK